MRQRKLWVLLLPPIGVILHLAIWHRLVTLYFRSRRASAHGDSVVTGQIYVNNITRIGSERVTSLEESLSEDFARKPPDDGLLTLFTTFAPGPDDSGVQAAVLANWPQSTSGGPLILYTPTGEDNRTEISIGRNAMSLALWTKRRPRTNHFKVPFLGDMFQQARRLYRTTFYGYANGDILFDETLVQTLAFIGKNYLPMFGTVLVIGRRTSCDVATFRRLGSLVSKSLSEVRHLANKCGVLDRSDAEDYFSMAGEYPWSKLPDLVVGRQAYDNYLVAYSVSHNVTVVDATKTVLALHIQGPGEYRKRRLADRLFNKWKLTNKFNYKKGMTLSAPYETQWDQHGRVSLLKRSHPFV